MGQSLDFSKFREVAEHPENQAKQLLLQGKKLIGAFHIYTPEPLIYAMGFIPFGMWGSELEVRLAKRYFPSFFCSIVQTNLEQGMQGRYQDFSAVLIPLLCDSLKCVSQNWKVGVPDVPMIPMNYPQNRESEAAIPYMKSQLLRVAECLEEISGCKLNIDCLVSSLDLYNEWHAAMREFEEEVARHPKEVTPYHRNCVLKSAYYMDKAQHLLWVRELTEQLKTITPARFRGIRVLTTGILADSRQLLEILEENKVAVVADEVAHESRQFRTDYDVSLEDPIEALIRQWIDFYGCSVIHGGKISREDYILELAEKYHVDGVILFLMKFCDPEEYDAPEIKRVLDEKKIPLLTIEVDQQISNYGQAQTAVQTFQEMIRL